ncbi:uncharacterized protein OCT59_012352 [Rhizophagus irregularis]|uniref:uncharacterized protein n=1 Tax=Rhizophagus irregularis TaxID=588596 RepID=UPI00332C93EB|nr:hypothetical protein OCT59_012352 [Rhizophagus irregularis]
MEQCWDADATKRPDISALSVKIAEIYRSYCQNENYEQIINITNTYNSLNTNFNVNSSSTNNSFFENSSKGSSNWNNSRVYSFENLPEPRNATKEEQDAYHSIQFDFNLQDGLIIAEEKSNKRSYFNDEKDLTVNPNKKVNSNNNEEVQYHEIGYQYMQINYTTSKMDLNYLLN